ncbi:MAG: heavy-metal-associated domain-containing protein [Bdellovibrionales bacterium]|nr:heavy-metal-associated domain-containing protein [Bdellovibrionales bacterium]
MRKIIFAALVLSNFGVFSSAWAEKACFEVQEMTCATCSLTIKAAVKKLKGISEVKVSFEEKNAMVDFDSQKINVTEIKKAIDGVGYKATPQECKKSKE